MSVYAMLGQWEQAVAELLPDTHGHQARALAAFSFAMARAQHCQSGRLAPDLPSPARIESRQRRWERLLANPRLQARSLQGQLARSLLERCGPEVLLLLDETSSCHNHLRCMRVSLAYRKRALPLAWICYPPGASPQPMPELLQHLLAQVAQGLREDQTVTLLADRGLAWPVVLDSCLALHWHYVLRLQGQTRVRLADRSTHAVRDLARCRGWRWLGPVRIFKKAGWRSANLVAVWEESCPERWLLVTDLPASFRRCLSYTKRTWCEQMHRDEKSSGFRWRESHLRDPDHAGRMLLVMALALLLCLSLGSYALKHSLRPALEQASRRLLSIFQLGLRWLREAVMQDHTLPCRCIYLYPP